MPGAAGFGVADEVVWFEIFGPGLWHALVLDVPARHGPRGRAKRLAWCGRWLQMRSRVGTAPNFAGISHAYDSPFCWHCVLKVAPAQFTASQP